MTTFFRNFAKKEEKMRFANQRRDKILAMIREDGQTKVADLSRIFKVTTETI